MLTRILSAIVLIPLLIALIWWAPAQVFVVVLWVVFAVAMGELRKLVALKWYAWLAAVYLVVPFALLTLLRRDFGPASFMILAGVIVISDSAQYFTGRAFGRHRLAPVISPKKTVEGAFGGLVFGSLAAIALARVWPVGLSDMAMLAAGFAMSIAGIVGDLFESWLKRRAGKKDSGNLIPGHGGILDRIDSWLFAAPVFWLILRMTR